VLPIGERTLYRKLREYHLVPDEGRGDGEGEGEVTEG